MLMTTHFVSYTLLALGVVLTLPYWLPSLIVRLRIWIFARVNGGEGILIPSKRFSVGEFKQLYAHASARGRSEGAGLSDLFWYWLAPGPEMHQEHLEAGPRYEAVAKTTRQILTVSKSTVAELTLKSIRNVMACVAFPRSGAVRLRDLMMPIWAEFYYSLVFNEPCPKHARDLIVQNADDVVSALKMTQLRHMKRRDRLTQYLVARLEEGALSQVLPQGFSTLERAYYLQGAFFNTAIVQTSEAMAHLLMHIAQHPDVQNRLVIEPANDVYIENVINESLRVHPLFGIAHRITTDDIFDARGQVIPRGSVLCFDFAQFHHSGYPDPLVFAPDRWQTIHGRDANFLPFGTAANRACPAQAPVLGIMRTALKELLRGFALHSSASHSRSLPNRGPCLLLARSSTHGPLWVSSQLMVMRFRDRWEDVSRSILQLFFGTYMIWEARRLALCKKHFAARPQTKNSDSALDPQMATPIGRCPFSWLSVQSNRSSHPPTTHR